MGSAINLEKIKQVHAEMHERQALFAQAKGRCDWSHEILPRKRATLFEAFDETVDRIASKIAQPPSKAKRIVAASRQPSVEAKRIVCKGKCLTISEWADATGLSDQTIRYRINHGWSEEEAVTVCAVDRRHMIARKAKPQPRVKDRSLRDLAAEHGISRHLLVDRLCRGIPLADALVMQDKSEKKRINLTANFTLEGRTMTLKQWAAHYKISPYTVRTRLTFGWQLAAALTVPPKAAVGRHAKDTRGWVEPSQDDARTSGVAVNTSVPN